MMGTITIRGTAGAEVPSIIVRSVSALLQHDQFMASLSIRAVQFKKFVYRSITYPLVLLTIFAAIISWRVLVLRDAAKNVGAADQAISHANQLLTLALDEEAGERGYLVNGNSNFLDRYYSASSKFAAALNGLQYDVRNSSALLHDVAGIREQHALLHDEIVRTVNISLRYPGNFRTYFDEGRENELMDAMTGSIGGFIKTETQLGEDHSSAVEYATTVTLISSAVLAVIFGLALGLALFRQAHQFADHYEDVLKVSQRNLSLLSATLLSIGDAVLVTDVRGKVIQMNDIAERLTNWKFSDAYQMDASRVFRIVDKSTRTALESPIERVLKKHQTSPVADEAILIKQDSSELSIEDSCSPILDNEGSLVGVILVFRDVSERKRAESELASLYEREHRIAESLQRSLLSKPDADSFPHLDVDTIYQPAWAEAKVGGDYYDIIALPNGKVAMIVGDVSGKGLKAASRTAEMKFTLRAYLRENDNVAEALSRLNKFVCQSQFLSDDLGSFFLCLTAVVVDGVSGAASVSVSGAEPPLIVRKDGRVEEIAASGAPVGVFEESEYSAVEVQLLPRDLLIIATDGITEARKDKAFLGNEGLGRLASNVRDRKPLSSVGEGILDGVKAFSDNHLSDDVCLLLARLKD